MNMRSRGLHALLLVLLALALVIGTNGPGWSQEKEKDSIKALFDGIPADLRSKVRDNPVRCDRVNDWLKDHVNGKGKTIEIRLDVNDVSTTRAEDGTYRVRLTLAPVKGNILEDDWRVHFTNQVAGDAKVPVGPFRGANNFAFEGVSTAEAEKLFELKQAVIQGKVLAAALARSADNVFDPGRGGNNRTGSISVALEDVRVDGKKWTPYIPVPGLKKGKGGPPIEQPKKGKGQTAP